MNGAILDFYSSPPSSNIKGIKSGGATRPARQQSYLARIAQMDYQFEDVIGRFCYKNQCHTIITTGQPRVTRRVTP